MNNKDNPDEDFLMIYSLLLFRDLVRTGSFTQTATHNHITQSAVSHQILSLEEKLGQSLVVRRYRSLQLTDAGRETYNACTTILDCYEKLRQKLSQKKGQIAGSIKIATTIAVGLHTLPIYSSPFIKKYPHVSINPVFLRGLEVSESILSRNADMGMTAHLDKNPLLKSLPFRKDTGAIITPNNSAYQGFSHHNIQKLFENPFIALKKNCRLGN